LDVKTRVFEEKNRWEVLKNEICYLVNGNLEKEEKQPPT